MRLISIFLNRSNLYLKIFKLSRNLFRPRREDDQHQGDIIPGLWVIADSVAVGIFIPGGIQQAVCLCRIVVVLGQVRIVIFQLSIDGESAAGSSLSLAPPVNPGTGARSSTENSTTTLGKTFPFIFHVL